MKLCAASAAVLLSIASVVVANHHSNSTLKSACGTELAELDNIWAYSNGGSESGCCAGAGSTGCRYQCVELAQRYFHVRWGIVGIWPNVQAAAQMCQNRPSKVVPTSKPIHGDLMVFSWAPDGHVTVIDKIVGNKVYVIEQNDSPNGRNTYTLGSEECFLHCEDNKPGCTNMPDGNYCGYTIGLDYDTVYTCVSGVVRSSTVCKDGGCMAHGVHSVCELGTCAANMVGTYCGNDRINGLATALYDCDDGHIISIRNCTNGCEIVPHADDKCR